MYLSYLYDENDENDPCGTGITWTARPSFLTWSLTSAPYLCWIGAILYLCPAYFIIPLFSISRSLLVIEINSQFKRALFFFFWFLFLPLVDGYLTVITYWLLFVFNSDKWQENWIVFFSLNTSDQSDDIEKGVVMRIDGFLISLICHSYIYDLLYRGGKKCIKIPVASRKTFFKWM